MKNGCAIILLVTVGVLLGISGCRSSSPEASFDASKCEYPDPMPKTAKEYIDLADHIVYKSGNHNEDPHGCALNACSAAIAAEPGNVETYVCRARRLRYRNEPEAALVDAHESIRLKPAEAALYRLRAGIYWDMERWDLAIADMTKFIEMEKPSWATDIIYHGDHDYRMRAEIYSESGNYEEAIRDYTTAIEINPDWFYHYVDRSKVYQRLGKTDLASADLEKAADVEVAAYQPNPSAQTRSGFSDARYRGAMPVKDLEAKAISKTNPIFPFAAKIAKVEGEVPVQILVNEYGNVIAARTAVGDRLLRGAAEQAALKWTFKPTLVNGRPVKITGFVTFTFILSDPRYRAGNIGKNRATAST